MFILFDGIGTKPCAEHHELNSSLILESLSDNSVNFPKHSVMKSVSSSVVVVIILIRK